MIRRFIQTFRAAYASRAAEAFRLDPDSPWLISFPRTGSHWLRMMLELYCRRPLLTRSFFPHDNQRYLLIHSHDYEFALRPRKLIYLYRDPVPTVFSQIKFHRGDPSDPYQVELWSQMYRLHLRHWLERAHDGRTVVRYEGLRAGAVSAMTPVLRALGEPVDADRLRETAAAVSREKVVEATTHDPRVMNTEIDYAAQREAFTARFAEKIRRSVIVEGGLTRHFEGTGASREAA